MTFPATDSSTTSTSVFHLSHDFPFHRFFYWCLSPFPWLSLPPIFLVVLLVSFSFPMTFPITDSSISSTSVFHVSHFSFPRTSASSTSVFQDCHDCPSPPIFLHDLICLLMCSTVSHLCTPCYRLHTHQMFGLWKPHSKLKPSQPFISYNRNNQNWRISAQSVATHR